nr:MAG TPA: hypothetical protein [Caudoviricetes sp.]
MLLLIISPKIIANQEHKLINQLESRTNNKELKRRLNKWQKKIIKHQQQ